MFSNLKTWLRGIPHGVSPQHLQAYLNEFTFRFNRRFYPFNAFRSLLGIAGGVTAPTYAEQLYAAKSRHTKAGCQSKRPRFRPFSARDDPAHRKGAIR